MTKPEESPFICWVDLETTGSRPTDSIIEIGAVMTDREFNHLSERQIVVEWPIGTEPIDIVREMHTANGLMAESKRDGVSRTVADLTLQAWIKSYSESNHIPLAGSGVGHFDRYYIRKDLPKFDKQLTYWVYDVGVVRRVLKLFGVLPPSADSTHKGKSHRALDDIKDHIEEMRMYKILLQSNEAIVRSLVLR